MHVTILTVTFYCCSGIVHVTGNVIKALFVIRSRRQLEREATFDDVSSPYKSSSSLTIFLISLHCTPSTNICQTYSLCYQLHGIIIVIFCKFSLPLTLKSCYSMNFKRSNKVTI